MSDLRGLTTDPDLHLIVGETALRTLSNRTGRYVFAVRGAGGDIRIASRCTVPGDLDARTNDRRRLGVPLRAVVLRGGNMDLMIHSGDAALSMGFHEAEACHRWTDGKGVLSAALLAPLGRDFTVELFLAEPRLRYRIEPVATNIVPVP